MPYTVLETYTKTLLCLSVIVNNAYMTCCVRIYLLSPYIIYCVHVISYNYIRMFVHYISNHTPQSLNSARVQQVGRAGTIVHTWHTSQTTALCVLRLLLLCWVPIVCLPSLVTVLLILTIILFDMSKISSSRPVLSDKPENTNGYLYLPVEVTWSYSDTVCMYTCVDVLYMYTHQTTLHARHTTCTHASLHAHSHTRTTHTHTHKHTHTHTHTHTLSHSLFPPTCPPVSPPVEVPPGHCHHQGQQEQAADCRGTWTGQPRVRLATWGEPQCSPAYHHHHHCQRDQQTLAADREERSSSEGCTFTNISTFWCSAYIRSS